jgi:hypothetical protein
MVQKRKIYVKCEIPQPWRASRVRWLPRNTWRKAVQWSCCGCCSSSGWREHSAALKRKTNTRHLSWDFEEFYYNTPYFYLSWKCLSSHTVWCHYGQVKHSRVPERTWSPSKTVFSLDEWHNWDLRSWCLLMVHLGKMRPLQPQLFCVCLTHKRNRRPHTS